ncbi:MAG: hypothetical protein Q9170_005231 [Blastenia crenularia]
MAPSLTSLPPELFGQITGYIHKNGHLLNLALCCSCLHGAVIPYLTHKAPGGGHYHPGLRGLTSRLVADPVLAACVRSIGFPNAWKYNEFHIDDDEFDFKYWADEYSDGEGGMCIGGREIGICRPEPAQVAKYSEDGMHVARVLLAVSNLQVLDIVAPCYNAERAPTLFECASPGVTDLTLDSRHFALPKNSRLLFKQAIREMSSAFQGGRPLQHLRVIACTFNDDQELMLRNSLALFLRLPSLREILVQTVHSGKSREDEGVWTWSPDCISSTRSGVERLEMRKCVLTDSEIGAILLCCSSLKTFLYDFFDDNLGFAGSEGDLTMPGLRKALSATETNLENLWIDCANKRNDFGVGLDYLYLMPPLSCFQKLKNLKVGMFLLFGTPTQPHTMDKDFNLDEISFDDAALPVLAQLLPQSVETIYISHTAGKLSMLVMAFENLLLIQSCHMPRLRVITFEAFLTGNPQAPSLDKLCDLAAAAEVKIYAIDTAIGIAEKHEWDRYLPTLVVKPRGPNLGQGLDGSVTWATAFDSAEWNRRFVIDDKHN